VAVSRRSQRVLPFFVIPAQAGIQIG
jgi:hypothetical protein